MPQQTTNTPERGSAITRTRGSQALLPLTVKQIMDASQTNDGFAVNGTEVSTVGAGCSTSAKIVQLCTSVKVRLVGRMLNKKQQVTDVTFVLDDGTGRIEMKRWDNETFDTEEMKLVKDGDYVIVIGGMKDFQGKRQVTAFSVRLVTNYNDITHHFLHCIYVHLDLARTKRSLSQPQVIANTSTRNQAPHTSYQAPTSSASGNTASRELSDLVMSVFLDPVLGNLEHGVSLDQVASRLNLSLGQTRSTVLDLVDLGNLYATIDDDHYKSTMNG
ncbi:replication protein A 32 kDa subunit B-like [Lolium rigidum]|uniref:replication protein A 32 kDa subunit B-like n=1 Tax=Lolium rigidum TaxID=89674 RepID=UPI001F5DB555|nr:replication protein A 32 kDa subunit B-like [Lolium rigidum]